jgi:integrase
MTEAKRRGHKRGHGEGTIGQRKDGRWCAQLMVGYKPDGTPDRRTVYGKNRADCQRKLDELRRKASGGLLGTSKQERETVAAFLDRWLSTTKSSVRPKTHKRYGEIARIYIIPVLGRHKLSALRPDMILDFYRGCLDASLSPATVRSQHAVLHRALEQAVRWGYLPFNPCDRVDPPTVPHTEIVPPTIEELGRLIDTAVAGGNRLQALWTVAVYSGCRRGELQGLQWDDVDFAAGTITIRRTLTSSKGGVPDYGEPKTASSRRTIALPPEATAALRAHRDRQDFEKHRLGESYSDYGLAFASELGTPLDQRNVTRSFKAALRRAGLPKTIRFHDLRHAHATMAMMAGVEQKVASSRLGHSTIRLTADLYTHAVKSLDVDAAERVQRLLRG